MSSVLCVSQLNFYLRSLLDENPHLQSILVKGEVTACRSSAAGHLYFTLAEGGSSISCVLFAQTAALLKTLPEIGQMCVVRAVVRVSERDSAAQLVVRDYLPSGEGKKSRSRAEYIDSLYQSGLLDPSRKKQIPALPWRIGLVAAAESAALADFLRILSDEAYGGEVVFCPALVQGEYAPQSIAAALKKLDALCLDVIVCSRGGGSKEDLEAFDHPLVVETALSLNSCLLSAVGHETDRSILDLVADLALPTPTAAAKKLTESQNLFFALLADTKTRMDAAMERILSAKEQKQKSLSALAAFRNRERSLYLSEERCKMRLLRMEHAMQRTLTQKAFAAEKSGQKLTSALSWRLGKAEQQTKQLEGALLARGPMETLCRGYAIPIRLRNGDIAVGEEMRLLLEKQELRVKVEGVLPRQTAPLPEKEPY